MRAYAQRSLSRLALDIMFCLDKNRVVAPMGQPEIVETVPGQCIEPSLALPDDFGQPLFDALWEAGYRPSQTQPAEQAIDALQNHVKFAEEMARTVMRAKFTPPIVSVPEVGKVGLR